MTRFDTFTAVPHADQHFAIASLSADRDLSAGRRMRDGVTEQVTKHLSDTFRVGLDFGQAGGYFDAQRELLFLSLQLQSGDGPGDDFI